MLKFLPLFCTLLLLSSALPAVAAPPEPLKIFVDASHLETKRINVRLTIPAKAGKLTLAYPGWLPGSHSVEGPLENVARVQMSFGNAPLSWQRDAYNPFVLHTEVPKGAKTVTVTYDYVFPVSSGEVFYGVATSKNLAIINPAAFALAPEGDPKAMPVSLTVQVPNGWNSFSSAMSGKETIAATMDSNITPVTKVKFAPTTLYTMIDSPIMTGQYHKAVELPITSGDVPHTLDIYAESEGDLKKEAVLTPLVTRLVAESGKLFGVRHYDSFRYLVALTNDIGRNGLEHHASVAYVFTPNDFDRAEGQVKASPYENWTANLLPHEFVHSWNGKYRRPYGEQFLSNDAPQSADLVWMYEGLTEYLGELLMVRSGFETPKEWRINIAKDAANLRQGSGRDWQSIADAALVMPHTYLHGSGTSLRPVNDVYMESRLVWLEADAIIRRESNGQRSLDDFCRLFFGGPNHGAEVKPYTRQDIVAALNQTQKYDWERFIQERFYTAPKGLPVAGFDAAGWELRFAEAPKELTADAESDLRFSLGFRVSPTGAVYDIIPGSLAEKSGIKPEMTILGVNGYKFSRARLREQIRRTAATDAKPSLDLLLSDTEKYFTITLNEVHGEGYPVLAPRPNQPDFLTRITTPLAPPPLTPVAKP